MFLHLSVIQFTGVSVRGCLCPGVFLSRGVSLSIGCFCPWGVSVHWVSLSRLCLCPERESLSREGVSVQGGVSVQRRSLSKGFLSSGSLSGGSLSEGCLCPNGVSVQGSLCQGDPHMVKSRWYACYWNAWFFLVFSLKVHSRKTYFYCESKLHIIPCFDLEKRQSGHKQAWLIKNKAPDAFLFFHE